MEEDRRHEGGGRRLLKGRARAGEGVGLCVAGCVGGWKMTFWDGEEESRDFEVTVVEDKGSCLRRKQNHGLLHAASVVQPSNLESAARKDTQVERLGKAR